jgi:rhomboid family GlyGly-CTERM serine protease
MRTRAAPSYLRARIAAAAAVLAAALLASAFPAAFLLERSALAHGEWWRLWTGHLVHASIPHFLLDVGATLVILPFVRDRAAPWVLAPIVGIGTLALAPELDAYGGLSGVLHGLALLAALGLARQERGTRRALAIAIAIGILAKSFGELALGRPFLTSSLDMGGTPVLVAHAIGAAAALVWSLARHGSTSSEKDTPPHVPHHLRAPFPPADRSGATGIGNAGRSHVAREPGTIRNIG